MLANAVGSAGRAGADSTVGEFIPRQVIIKLGTSSAIVEEINTTYGSLPGNLSRVVSDIYIYSSCRPARV
jgi:hypothetical protein